MTRPVLGLDIGGANLKAAHTSGAAKSVPFALWRNPGGLDAALGRLVAEMPAFDALAVTMTGELCDCFASKREGVNHILDAVEGRAKTVRVWTNEGEFVDVPTARREALKVASANWLALATFVGRYAPEGPAILIDVGTTTTDVIALMDGAPVAQGRTDPERLASRELIYRGWKRTPLCAMTESVYAAELFATMQDACLLLGLVPEDAADRDTADGRPATIGWAELRIARMMCADLESSTPEQRRQLAWGVHCIWLEEVSECVRRAAGRLPWPAEKALATGSGSFLVQGVLEKAFRDPRRFDPGGIDCIKDRAVSAAGCAHAVAVLAQEQEG